MSSAILIGIGGAGGSIVSNVRTNVALRVARAGNAALWQAEANQIRYLLVDTREEPYHGFFLDTEKFVVPRGFHRFRVNDQIRAWYESDDPSFREWWPKARSGAGPFQPDDYDEGAGQVRPKGRLAYRLHLDGERQKQIVPAVLAQVASLQNALNLLADPNRKIRIYLICSLGGGTGSGVVLTLAQHLAQELPPNCAQIGVFLLASVTEMAAERVYQTSIWANTDAALREIEFFQLPSSERSSQIRPFLAWPGAGNQLIGDQRTFEYVYLFGAANRNGKHLDEFGDYVRLIAESLTTELFSDIATAVGGSHSNFMAVFQNVQDIGRRSVRYASASKSDVRYPIERISIHLARRFGARVIRERLLTAGGTDDARLAGIEAADKFLQDQQLLWTGQPSLRQAMLAPLPSDEALQPMPALDDAKFQAARADAAANRITQTRQRFETWRDTRLGRHLELQQAAKLATYDGIDGELLRFVDQQLATKNGDGFVRGRAAAEEIVKRLDAEVKAIRSEIVGEPDAPPEKRGLKPRVEDRRRPEAWDRQLRRFNEGFGRFFNRDGEDAKREFLDRWWNRYTLDERNLRVAETSLEMLQQLLTFSRRIAGALNEITVLVESTATAFAAAASDDLGENVRGGVLDLGVMDEVRLVDHHFRGTIDRFFQKDREAAIVDPAAGVADEAVSAEGAIRTILRRKLELSGLGGQEQLHDNLRTALQTVLLGQGERMVREDVERLSVWDALALECQLRQELDLPEPPLKEALTALRQHQADLERAGLTLDDSLGYLLEKYIARKLDICRERGEPFWQLDDVMIRSYTRQQLPHVLKVLAYDKNAYDDFVAKYHLDAKMMENVARTLGIEPTGGVGRDTISIYAREGVVPLHFLDEAERRNLRSRAAQLGDQRQLHVDQRYYDTIDPFIAPRDEPDQRRRYVLVSATHFGLATIDYGDSAHAVSLSLNGATPQTYRGVIDADLWLENDPAALDRLAVEIDARWRRLREELHAAELAKMIEYAERQIAAAPNTVEQSWWGDAAGELRGRARHDRYLVGR
jgi:Tubulin like